MAEALAGCATARSDGWTEQQIAGEADDPVEQPVELLARNALHDPGAIPRLVACAADAPEREEVVGRAERGVDLGDQGVGEWALDVLLDGLEDAVDPVVVA